MKAVHFRPDLNVNQREQELKKLCITEKEENFFRTLTDSDVDKEKHLYAEKGGELKEKKAEAKASAETFKTAVQAIEKDMDERLERIQTRKRKVYDKLYGLANYGTGLMEYYDRFGELIDSRKLTPDEATGHLFNNNGGAATQVQEEAKQLGYDNAGDLEDGQKNSDIQEAEFEEVQDAEVAPAVEPYPNDADNLAPAEEEGQKDEKTTKTPRKPRKKKDEGTNTENE